jgi:cytochrome b6-f complex iron-sulfur subunit
LRGRLEDRVSGFVDDLLRRRRPRRFQAAPEELEALMAAAELAPARPGADLPDPRFIDRLERRLRKELEDRPSAERRWTRRGLLQAAGAAAAAAVVGVAADRVVAGSAAPASGSGSLIPNGARWRPVLAFSELPPGAARTFSTGAVQGVLVNDNGKVRALSGVCTHLGCILKPNAESATLDCPCHRTVFDWAGQVRRHQLDTAPARLPLIESRVRDGQVEVLVV